MSKREGPPIPFGKIAAFILGTTMVLLLIVQCTGNMPKSPFNECAEKGGVYMYKIHKCVDPNVFIDL